MTLMLASVANTQEAEIALAGGADIIDFKDPTTGALGAVPHTTISAMLRALAGRVPTSAVIGDLPLKPESLRSAAAAMAETGVDFVKIGLFGTSPGNPANGPALDACLAALAPVADQAKLVAVVFAEHGVAPELASRLAANRFTGVMLDTAEKGFGRLLDHMSIAALRDFVERARAVGLLSGLAGSLEVPDIPRLLPLRPDVLGFRSALCPGGDRRAGIDRNAVRSIVALVRATASPPKPVSLAPAGPDKVVVENLVVSVPVGAYARERAHKQRVRFDVTVELAPRRTAGDHMEDVYSYDVITDAVAELAETGHVLLVETLAETLAQRILSEPRARKATIRVSKLDLGPGAIGVEITRVRTPADE
ncbi:(5-formylfuran-3-yl)methyl phosphate synthase [Rhodoligotrophos defluvii]|uniref:(5-formylfuran-3-yl)methyl phosphate synthase n=1 Tax=Rhodoligotrophos defluvii TaxID=2561934 RepID=UPI0010CA1750|nr:(5-formylfuran-3-yl)methyl phosphate synthase [Rhodoligotrophos defluvii]